MTKNKFKENFSLIYANEKTVFEATPVIRPLKTNKFHKNICNNIAGQLRLFS